MAKTFLIEKLSSLRIEGPKVGYYQKMRHLKDGPSMPERFLGAFNSQVYPTILPGTPIDLNKLIVPELYLSTELDFRLLTETDINLILDE